MAVSGGEAILSIYGCRTISRAGAPMVPVFPAVFVIPPGDELVSVTVTPLDTEILPMPAPVAPMPDQVSPGRAWSGVKGRDQSIYGASGHWPPLTGELSTVQRKGGIALAFVNIYPLRPSGSEGIALFTPRVSVTIETRGAISSDKGFSPRISGRSAAGLSALVENPEGLDAYGMDGETVPDEYLSASPVPYVIITSAELAGPFGQLASFRERHGLKAEVVTTAWIESSYAGADLQERIRSFIRQYEPEADPVPEKDLKNIPAKQPDQWQPEIHSIVALEKKNQLKPGAGPATIATLIE